MSRVITMSTVFPAYHPRSGQTTGFVEKFHWWFWSTDLNTFSSAYDMLFKLNKHLPEQLIQDFIDSLDDDTYFKGIEKHHTIRSGHRFKEGDWFSPRVWSGRPYNSKQIIIAPDIQIKKTWNFKTHSGGAIYIEKNKAKELETLARYDGLSLADFFAWFKFPSDFDGQIICWSNEVKY